MPPARHYDRVLVEREEWENDPEYPRAPLPPHERQWRHPSELGETHWTRSEPPLVVGRGLSIATGTVGAILALGLLWLMIPHADRGGVAVEASAPNERPQATARTLAIDTTSPESFLAPTSTPTTVRRVVTTTTMAVVRTEPPTSATDAPVTSPPATTESTPALQSAPAMAVALMPGHLVVTTAGAVNGRTEMQVQLPSGDLVRGSVVTVDDDSGTAVLSIPVEIANPQLAPTAQVDPSEGLVKGSAANIWTDDEGTQVSAPEVDPQESALVLDPDGGLIGMCTKGARGMRLVAVGSLLDAINAVFVKEAPQWLGVQAQLSDTGDITIVAVADDGAAAAAGVQAGDVVKAIDGVSITDFSALRTTVLAHRPGDAVTVTVLHAGAAATTDVSLTLPSTPWPR